MAHEAMLKTTLVTVHFDTIAIRITSRMAA